MSGVPQTEDGYTRIANELLDAIIGFGFSARQMRVFMTLVRKIYGFNKKRDDISGSQIGEACGMPRSHVSEVLSQLSAMRVISKKPGTFGTIIEINKNYKDWIAIDADRVPKNISPKEEPKQSHYTYRVTRESTGEFYIGARTCLCHPNQDRYLGSGNWICTVKAHELQKQVLQIHWSRAEAEAHEIHLIKSNSSNPLIRNSVLFNSTESVHPVQDVYQSTDSVQGVQKTEFSDTDSVQVDDTESVHTKDNLPKDNRQKTKSIASQAMRDRFERFYAAYPKKKSRVTAETAFFKIAPDEQLLSEIISGVLQAMKSEQWREKQYIPYPASWLKAGGWKDEIQTEFTDPERAVIQAFNDALGEHLGSIDSEIFVEKRAAAIRDFLTLSEKPDFHIVYFTWVRDNCELPSHVGFDWLITRESFTKIKGGQHGKKL
jgi:phage replication O-like protein O